MKQTVLTAKQSELLENLIARHGQIVVIDQIYEEAKANWDLQQTKNLVVKLVRNGWLIRIKKGLYAISDLSNRGFLSLSPYIVANLLVKESYVSFESALAYHGMFDQLTNKIISISTSKYKDAILNNIEYDFLNVKDQFFFGWQEVIIDNQTVKIAYAEKALVDIIHFHRSKYSVDLVIEKLKEYQASLDMKRLNEFISKMSIVTVKTFGLVFDLLGIDSDRLFKLVEQSNTTLKMLPDDTKFNAKWRLYYDEYFDKYADTTTTGNN
jgi:predicted transcriptional regulator of viral defense system